MKTLRPLNSALIDSNKIGIAISTYNSEKVIKRCLLGLKNQNYKFVIFDDASTDETINEAKKIIPNLVLLNGDGSSWWGGGTARAVDKCFSLGCDFVLMLNPDAIISSEDIKLMADYTSRESNLITAALVVGDDNNNKLLWGGSKLMMPKLKLLISKYIYKKNSEVSKVSPKPYETHEVHGRGVMISRSVYNMIGTLDWKKFPHYGADNDYSLRALSAGIKLMILPSVKVRLAENNSGMKLQSNPFSLLRIYEVFKFLTRRKNGEYLFVLWKLNIRHTPLIFVIPSFFLSLVYVTFRKLSQSKLLI